MTVDTVRRRRISPNSVLVKDGELVCDIRAHLAYVNNNLRVESAIIAVLDGAVLGVGANQEEAISAAVNRDLDVMEGIVDKMGLQIVDRDSLPSEAFAPPKSKKQRERERRSKAREFYESNGETVGPAKDRESEVKSVFRQECKVFARRNVL